MSLLFVCVLVWLIGWLVEWLVGLVWFGVGSYSCWLYWLTVSHSFSHAYNNSGACFFFIKHERLRVHC